MRDVLGQGGVTHGPLSTRDYSQKVNKKMKIAALFSALSKKLKDSELKVVRDLRVEEPKTKRAAFVLKQFANAKKPESFLLIPEGSEKHLFRASANIPRVKSLAPTALNVYDVLRYKNVLVDERALAHIVDFYKK